MAKFTGDSLLTFQIILNPRDKMPLKQADPTRFAHMVQREMESLMSDIASDEREIIINGQRVDKLSSLGSMIINDKLAEVESRNTQNFSLMSAVRKAEDSLRQILG